MLFLPASAADISSNARVKLYPRQQVLQVSNAPIFRERGWEPRKRQYAVPSKGCAADPERSKESSIARARAAVRDIALCNCFDHFFTWTLDGKRVDRYDPEAVGAKMRNLLKNLSYRKGFQYVLVPELHADGAIHMHGLCNLGRVRVVQAINPHTGAPLFASPWQPIYNMQDWPLGYSTCIPIVGGEEGYQKTCNYLVKYLSKGTEKIFGKRYYSSRDLTKRPPVQLVHGLDFDQFMADNPEVCPFPLFRDVCMAAKQLEGGGCL